MSDTATSPAGTAPDTAAPALTPKQEAFARHYAASGNGAAAARAAGYAPDGAKQAAHELLQHPGVAARVAVLEDAHGRTLRGEVAVVLDRLDAAVDMALQAGDYRALLDITRLQAQVAALTGPDAAHRRALLYDRAGGPGPLVRSRSFLDPHAAIDPEAHAEDMAARRTAEIAADEAEAAAPRARAGTATAAERAALEATVAAGVKRNAELAALAAEVADLEADLEAELEAGRRTADPDFSLPIAGGLPGIAGKRPSAPARAALMATAAPVRVPEMARQAA